MLQVKRYRTLQEMSQADLATRMGTTQQTINRWENGDSEPSIEAILKLSAILEVSVDELFGTQHVPAAVLKAIAGKKHETNDTDVKYYSDVELHLPGVPEALRYPINGAQCQHLLGQLNGLSNDIGDWIMFKTINHRTVLFRLEAIESVIFTDLDSPSSTMLIDAVAVAEFYKRSYVANPDDGTITPNVSGNHEQLRIGNPARYAELSRVVLDSHLYFVSGRKVTFRFGAESTCNVLALEGKNGRPGGGGMLYVDDDACENSRYLNPSALSLIDIPSAQVKASDEYFLAVDQLDNHNEELQKAEKAKKSAERKSKRPGKRARPPKLTIVKQ